jgi:hypothetical protein
MANVFVGLFDSQNGGFETDNVVFAVAAAGPLPKTVAYGYPVPGTVHRSGNLGAVKVWSNRGYLPLEWTVTIYLTPRPGYNTGGLTTAEAPVVHDNDTLHLSLTNLSTKNYYKVTLKPGGTLNVTGTMTNDWTTTNAQIIVRVYDAAQQYVGLLSSTPVPAQSTVPIVVYSTFTSSSPQTAPYYISFERGYSSADLSASTVQVHAQEANLKLFLDSDGSFSTGAPDVDLNAFVPGSSGSTPECPAPSPPSLTPLQQVQVIAGYVDQNGVLVTPPANTSVSFALQDTSALAGVAMNALDPRGDGPDYVLATASAPFNPTDKTARVCLQVWDYGGSTTVTASAPNGSAVSMKLPVDVDANLVPDGGYEVYRAGVLIDAVPGTGFDTSEDADSSGPGGQDGDGITAFEEYRGFIVGAEHRRIDPRFKDLFVYSQLLHASNDGVGDVMNLGVPIHRLIAGQFAPTRVVNFTLDASASPGHLDQHAVLVYDGGLNFLEGDESAAYGWVWCVAGNGGCVPSTVGEELTVDILHPQRNVMVLTGIIGLESNEGSDIYGEDPADVYITDLVVAHEVGHAAHIPHYQYSGAPPARLSVMVAAIKADEPWFAGWHALPTDYDPTDLSNFRLKP